MKSIVTYSTIWRVNCRMILLRRFYIGSSDSYISKAFHLNSSPLLVIFWRFVLMPRCLLLTVQQPTNYYGKQYWKGPIYFIAAAATRRKERQTKIKVVSVSQWSYQIRWASFYHQLPTTCTSAWSWQNIYRQFWNATITRLHYTDEF